MDKIFDTSVKYLTDLGADRQEAETFVKDLCDKVPAFYGKFCIGVLRWIMEEEIDVENDGELEKLNLFLMFISGTEAGDSYNGNFNGLPFKEVVKIFDMALDAPDYVTPKDARYTAVRVQDYDALMRFKNWTADWCITASELAFDGYSKGGENRFFLLLRDDYRDVPKKPCPGFPDDSYGTSIYCVIVNPDGSIDSVTNRWNTLSVADDDPEGFLRKLLGPDFITYFK